MMDQFLTNVLDWFVMEGGDVRYEHPDEVRLEDESALVDGVWEIRFPEFEVYVGPTPQPACNDLEVAALVRSEISLEPDSLFPLIEPIQESMPAHLMFEIPHLESPLVGSSVWLVTQLIQLDPKERTEQRLTELLDYAHRSDLALR
jgi:hypothetical protein